jgi:hypothetical protein
MDQDTAADLRTLARRHLLLRLRATNRALARAVARQAGAQARITRPDLNALCVTDEQVLALLEDVHAQDSAEPTVLREPEPDEIGEEAELRRQSFDGLPLDVLARTFALSAFEQDALLLCAAVEVDRRYERIFAYVLDDLDRRQPSVELLCTVMARDADERLAYRAEIGRFGRLRRTGLLLPVGDARSELRQELRLAPALLEWLLTAAGDPAAFVDPADVAVSTSDGAPEGVDTALLAHLVSAMCTGDVSVAGLFGPRGAGHDACARAIAAGVGRPLRRLAADSAAALDEGLDVAAALGAIVWLDVDPLT